MRQQYRIVDVLGRGPLGTVYLAERVGGAGGHVALKIFDPSRASEVALRRLEAELPRLGWVKDARVVRIQSLVQVGGSSGLVSDHVDGCDLGRILRQGQVPPGVAMEIVAAVAGGLNTALTQPGPDGEPLRLAHLDLRPGNVMVTRWGDVRLLDHGVARALSGGDVAELRRLDPELRGAPEVAGGGAGPAADVYACGQILFELLAGRPLLRAGQDAASHRALLSHATEQLLMMGVDPLAVTLADALLAWEAESRPAARDVEKLARELRRNVGGATLREWASEVIPDLSEVTVPGTDPLVDTTLSVTESVARPGPSRPPSVVPLPAPRAESRIDAFDDEDETVTATLPGRFPPRSEGEGALADEDELPLDPDTYHGLLEPEATDTMVMKRPPELAALAAPVRLPPMAGAARPTVPAPPSVPPVVSVDDPEPAAARGASIHALPGASVPGGGIGRGTFVPGGAPPVGPGVLPRPRLLEGEVPADPGDADSEIPGAYRPGGALPRHPHAPPEGARLDDVPPVPPTPPPPAPPPRRVDPPSLPEPPREEYREAPRDLFIMALPAGCFLLVLLAAGAFYAWLRFR